MSPTLSLLSIDVLSIGKSGECSPRDQISTSETKWPLAIILSIWISTNSVCIIWTCWLEDKHLLMPKMKNVSPLDECVSVSIFSISSMFFSLLHTPHLSSFSVTQQMSANSCLKWARSRLLLENPLDLTPSHLWIIILLMLNLHWFVSVYMGFSICCESSFGFACAFICHLLWSVIEMCVIQLWYSGCDLWNLISAFRKKTLSGSGWFWVGVKQTGSWFR